MGKFLSKYIEDMLKKELSKNTIEAYKRDLLKFAKFLNKRHENILESDMVSIMAYVQILKKERKADSSIIRSLVAIRNFYKFLIKTGENVDNPLINYEVPKNKRTLPEILTVDEVDKFLSSPDCSEYKGIRDKAMLELMYATGMKVSELLKIRSEEHTSELQSRQYLVCRLLLEKKKIISIQSKKV